MHHTSVLGLKYEVRLTEPKATSGLDAPDPHFNRTVSRPYRILGCFMMWERSNWSVSRKLHPGEHGHQHQFWGE